MDIFEEAGLPDGVINMIFGDPEMITNQVYPQMNLLVSILLALLQYLKIFGKKLE